CPNCARGEKRAQTFFVPSPQIIRVSPSDTTPRRQRRLFFFLQPRRTSREPARQRRQPVVGLLHRGLDQEPVQPSLGDFFPILVHVKPRNATPAFLHASRN